MLGQASSQEPRPSINRELKQAFFFLLKAATVQGHIMGLLLLLASKCVWQRERCGSRADVFSKATVSHNNSNTSYVM